jgi:hypothetical protein
LAGNESTIIEERCSEVIKKLFLVWSKRSGDSNRRRLEESLLAKKPLSQKQFNRDGGNSLIQKKECKLSESELQKHFDIEEENNLIQSITTY